MPFTTLIDVSSLKRVLDEPWIAVIDCRFDLAKPDAGRLAYLAGHIAKARYADLNRDLSAPVRPDSGRHPLPEPPILAATLGRLGIGNGSQVIAYDDSGGSFAARLWWMLRWMGHTAAAVLDGGFQAWLASGGALSAGEEPPAHPGGREVGFVPRLDDNAVLRVAEVAARLSDPRFSLVDARAAERFAGTVEPIDTVAGHVPGAVNHPFSENLGKDGRFLPVAELRRLWLKRLEGKEPANAAAMCGSGVTACHNLLALEVAALSGAKLYAGSWSEWIRDSNRPVARDLKP
ncbi:MAG TPA: sulfurtransferase [Steroidobacteraceae bacterium]